MTRIPFTLAAAAIAMTVATLAPTAAEAHPRYGYGDRYEVGDYYRGGGGYYRGDGGYYRSEGRHYGRHRGWRCDRGNGGTVIGAIAGGLLGNEIGKGNSHRGDGTNGAIIGAGIGALIGRAADRDC